MPRSKVINRRNVRPLVQWTTSATKDAVGQLRDRAALLNVSQGSLVDTAVRELLRHSPEKIADIMRTYKHLSEDEHDAVLHALRERSKGGGC